MADPATRFVNAVAKGTGWTRDFTGDVLMTAGGSLIAYFAAEKLLGWLPYAPVIAACVVAAMLWKRARRDNP